MVAIVLFLLTLVSAKGVAIIDDPEVRRALQANVAIYMLVLRERQCSLLSTYCVPNREQHDFHTE
jgi:hypothetical protein